MTSSLTRAEMRAHLRTLTVGESLTLETAMGYPTALDRVHVNLRQAADAVRGCFSVCLDKNNGQTRATRLARSEEHTSELQSLMRISYAVFCLKKKKNHKEQSPQHQSHNTCNKYIETNKPI